MEDAIHKSVLLEEALADLQPRERGRYLDGTVGLGGHTRAILERAPGGEVCGLDRDGEALEIARERLRSFGDRARLFHLPFAQYAEALDALGWTSVDGALLDLGVSSMQLDKADRGFSFREDAPLDMRMDQTSSGKSAFELVNRATFEELKNILVSLGEEPLGGKIAREIINSRGKSPIKTTGELAEQIWRAYPVGWRKSARNHPATRSFQALRMAVNDELGQLELFLDTILDRLADRGRLVIISFHSLEDRIVKRKMKEWAKGDNREANGKYKKNIGRESMAPPERRARVEILHKKPLVAGEDEIATNPRSRSAKLRACIKIS